MNDTLNTSLTIKAPDIPAITSFRGDVLVQLWGMDNDGHLVERKILICTGVVGWKEASAILNEPEVVYWEAQWHGNTGFK